MATPELIYCAGKNQQFEAIALAAGFTLGVQLPGTVYHPIAFADQDPKRPPKRAVYMDGLAKHRPRLATVLDWSREEQLTEVVSWAEEAAQYVERVIIIDLEQKAAAATPGAWYTQWVDVMMDATTIVHCYYDKGSTTQAEANAAYIAALNPETLGELLTWLKHLLAQHDRFVKAAQKQWPPKQQKER